jgi:allantoinase
MENMRFHYSPIIERKRFTLPGHAKVAVWVVPNIEYYDIGIPLPRSLSNENTIPDVRNYTVIDYGVRIGIWRLMDVLDKHKIKATVALNSAVCSQYPIIVENCKKRSWEFMGHSITNSVRLSGIGETEERQVIASTLDTIAQAVGERPKGWLSPGLSETFNTPDLLAEEGIKYLCDWCSDDQPYIIKVKKGNLISIPYSQQINDIQLFIQQHVTPRQFYEIAKDQFETLYEEGDDQARVMAIALHPFLIGVPFRIRWLDKLLQHIKDHGDVWFATGWEIASWYYENYVGGEGR